MAIIYSYPTESPSPKDLILGMQTANDKKTVVFTIESLTGSLSDAIINNNLPASFSTISSSAGITGDLVGNTLGHHSGTLHSTVTGSTQPLGTDNTTIATTAFVQASSSVGPFILGTNDSILGRDSSITETGSPEYSLAFGRLNTLGASYSVVGGYLNSVTAPYSTAFGKDNISSGSYSSTLGMDNESAGQFSSVLSGQYSLASGQSSTVLSGLRTVAAGTNSLAAGANAAAISSGGISLGYGTSTGISTTFGVGSTGAVALGRDTLAMGSGSFATGQTSTGASTFTIIQAGTGFTTKDDYIQSVTDSTNAVTIQVKIIINSAGIPTSIYPLDFPPGFATGLSFSITPASGGANLTFSIASTWKRYGSHNNFAVSMGDDCYSGGQHSFALGQNAYVEGLRNFAYGDNVKIDFPSSGHNVLFGKDTHVQYGTIYSTVFGNSHTVQNASYTLVNGWGHNALSCDYGTILGYDNSLSGDYGAAIGRLNSVTLQYGVAIGDDNTSSGISATAIGTTNTASGNYSFVAGRNHAADGDYSSALGSTNTVSGNYSVGAGSANQVSGDTSVALGSSNTVSGNYASALGISNSVVGDFGVALGENNNVNDIGSVAIGDDNTISGQRSLSIGTNNTISGNGSLALGNNNTVAEANNVVVGRAKNTLPLASSLAPRFEVGTGGTGGTGNGAQTVSVYAMGSGYPAGASTYSTAVTSGGSGTGLQVEIVANYSTGAVISAGVISSGSGYSVGDLVAITGAAAGSGAILQVASLGDNSYTSLSVAVPHGTGSGTSPHAASGLVFTALKDSPSYADDAAAATGGVNVSELYHTAGVVKVRLV